MNLDDETLQFYVEESREHLSDIETDLLAIEQGGAEIDEELVNKVFRAAHSIKGGAGFMGLTNIKELSHKMENVLGMIRSRDMVPTAEAINILLLAADALKDLINNVSSSNEIDVSEHIDALARLTEGSLSDEDKDSVSKMIDICLPDGKVVFAVTEYDISNARKGGKFVYLVKYDLIHDVHNKDKTPLGLLREMEKSGVILESKIDLKMVGALEDIEVSNQLPFFVLFATILEPNMVNALFEVEESGVYEIQEDLTPRPIGQPTPTEPVVPEETKPTAPETEEPAKKPEVESKKQKKKKEENKKHAKTAADADKSLRVNLGLLDSLMNLAGELVLGRNQLLEAVALSDLSTIKTAGQRLDLITSELQEAIMLTRMQPIGNIFNKFPRVVRDLALNLGKDVELVLEGNDVELDKTIIEGLSDPLTHLVRNSVDHGIETPEVRQEKGKGPSGKLMLKAYHEAGQVNIEIADDGKGMGGDQLAAKALSKGLISAEQVSTMSEKEKVSLIFLPGFSTAEEVTDLSGRGVGMDVVKTNLDKLGGNVDISARPGEGTSVRIKLPLTLAIIPSQIISNAGERYAIPQVNMDELMRIPASEVKYKVETVGDAEVVRLRGQLLPLVRLLDVLGIQGTYIDPADGTEKPDRRKSIADRRSRQKPDPGTDDDRRDKRDRRYHAASAIHIVVLSAGLTRYGLVVDKLHDPEEIVVKPLGRHLKHCKGYAGATIMGDGEVALILDVAGLAHMAKLASVEETDRAVEVAEEFFKSKEDVQSLLIFRSAEDEQFCVPLGLVERVEKISRADIEEVGEKKVMQYRGTTLPLLAIDEVVQVKPLADQENPLVIVFMLSGREVGLLAAGPVDAAEVSATFDDSTLKQHCYYSFCRRLHVFPQPGKGLSSK
jgi:two-component system chemotaxis sensor kinase CheA